MLKSTHRVASSTAAPLPPGWTEHKAPTGHTYYYNAETKKSTYTRPSAPPPDEELQIDFGATQPDHEVQASLNALQQFHKHNDPSQPTPGHFTGGRSYQDRSRPNRQGDRPKSKAPIPNCAPWVLVKTKYGRRFVHNTETRESLWKFPSEVMMAVIDMDRIEWEKKKADEDAKEQASKKKEQTTPAQPSDTVSKSPVAEAGGQYDSDSYEEVEVTDSEGEGEDNANKKPRLDSHALDQSLDDPPPAGPQEFNEDDIAFQLAALEAEDEDPGYDYDDPEAPFDFSDEEDDGGVPLTRVDREALFRSLLDEHNISPFSTFDALIDTNTPTAHAVISDHRWVTLPNMSARRATFASWSRDRVAERNANENAGHDVDSSTNGASRSSKSDPRISYLNFLSINATPKLYWPEFKRKFRKDSAMTDRHFAEKDREKLYREYIPKLKMSDSDRRKEFTALLKSISKDEWQGGDVPATVEKDIRYYGVRDEKRRKELVDAFLGR